MTDDERKAYNLAEDERITRRFLDLGVPVPCRACDGAGCTGSTFWQTFQACTSCNGTGLTPAPATDRVA